MIAVLLILVFLSALFSGCETASYAISSVRLLYRATEGSRAARLLSSLMAGARRFVFAMLLYNNLVLYLVSGLVTNWFVGLQQSRGSLSGWLANPEVAATLVLTLPMFLFAELLPKELFRRNAEHFLFRLPDFLTGCCRLAAPFTWLLDRLFALLIRRSPAVPAGAAALSAERLRLYFAEGLREGALSAHQGSMLEKTLSMRRIPLSRLMTPVSRLPAVSEDDRAPRIRAALRGSDTGHCLVYGRHRNDIMGSVHVFDMLRAENPDATAGEVMRAPLRLRSDMSLRRALSRMRSAHQSVALAVNSRGRAVGQVRLEDIARFIAGSDQE